MTLVFCALMFNPRPVIDTQNPNKVMLSPMANEPIQFSVLDAGSFNNKGIYLCRPEVTNTENVYKATISTAGLIEDNQRSSFRPEFTALVCRNDQWVDITNQQNLNFWVNSKEDTTNYSVAWYLRESAPAALYAVKCYDQASGINRIFEILYTQDWTYINVTNNDGLSRISNFVGGSDLTLNLNVTFNDGAADPSLGYTEQTTGVTDVRVGAISDYSSIVSLSTMDITVKTVSGKVYPTKSLLHEIDANVNNRVALRFTERLENDIYLIQFTSKANNRIIGQFIIDNTKANGGVNLSRIWVILMIFGGVLALGAASAYLVPLFIVKFNEIRVDRENDRVARMKNPEKYATKNKKSFKETINKIIYNIKTPAYKRKKDQKQDQEKPVEEKVYSNRFTEMLRERQEKRNFMQEHNVSSAEMEKMKEAEAVAAADEANSFAFLREDDDDEIATFHAAQDEVSTLETGSYVKGGATFAKLDSLRDSESQDDGEKE